MTKDLPFAVRKRLAEKREAARVIGICELCSEEVYANRDGILRTQLMSGSEKCLLADRHRIGRFLYLGPAAWVKKWVPQYLARKIEVPDWASYWLLHYSGRDAEIVRVKETFVSATNASVPSNSSQQ